MDSFDRQTAAAQFTQPVRQVLLMLFCLVLVVTGSYLAYPRVAPVFLSNPYLNGVIFAVFVFGVLACFWQVLQLSSSISWIKRFLIAKGGNESRGAPRLLASVAPMLVAGGSTMQISTSSSRTLLDSIAIRMDEARDITRYIINLLIFLGLLGTFYGLATTIPGVVDTIRSLNPQEGESSVAVFGKLMTGLEGQLAGMGTAFASSLLGLAGSLVVGLLELFAGHGQNRFYREMEEWLSTITRVGFASGEGEGGGLDQGVVATVLDHMVEQIDSLQDLFAKSEAAREESDARIDALMTTIIDLTNRMEATESPNEPLNKLAHSQEKLLGLLTERFENDADPEAKMRLRNIDVQLLKVLEEVSAGRQESLALLHRDMGQLIQAVRAGQRDPRTTGTRAVRGGAAE